MTTLQWLEPLHRWDIRRRGDGNIHLSHWQES